MKTLVVAAAAFAGLTGVGLTGSAEAARYYEFKVSGQTGIAVFDPLSGVESRYVVDSDVTARFDTLGSPLSFGNGFAVAFSPGNLFTLNMPAGTSFNITFDQASVPVGDTLVRLPAAGSFGYISCIRTTCFNTPGTLLSFQGRTSDTAPATLAATESVRLTAIGLPEPATWAMMVLGVGLIGYGLRRRSTAVRIRFA